MKFIYLFVTDLPNCYHKIMIKLIQFIVYLQVQVQLKMMEQLLSSYVV